MHVCVCCVCVFCPKLVWKLLCNLCWSEIHSNNPASASQVPELSTCALDHVRPEQKTGNAEEEKQAVGAVGFPSQSGSVAIREAGTFCLLFRCRWEEGKDSRKFRLKTNTRKWANVLVCWLDQRQSSQSRKVSAIRTEGRVRATWRLH